jgi:hypothetical protein
MYAYNRDSGKAARGYEKGDGLAIFQFAKVVLGSANEALKVRAAPPRQLLRSFGGYMSIEAFRECATTLARMPPKCVLVEQVFHDKLRSESRERDHINHPITTAKAPTSSSGEMLKVKGAVPKKKRKTILEETLGV